MPSQFLWLPLAVSPTLAESSRLSLWEPREYKSERLFWRARNLGPAYNIAMLSAVRWLAEQD
jgi:hypothetical protein